jgi:asparagine synthase (glutamine-hydrolysing)
MGAISFIIYDNTYYGYNNNFVESFLKLKKRGCDDTTRFTEQSPVKRDMFKMQLSRSEFMNYKTYIFIYDHHRLCINDTSCDALQPFEDPILHKINKYKILNTRPKRKLLCEGEIYNYTYLKKSEEFNDKDLQSECDVEIIMPLYIKYGIEESLRMLNGDFCFVLTENVNAISNKEINVYCARDRYGIRPLWYIHDQLDKNFFMFISDLSGVPDHIKSQSQYKIEEVPPGTYWSFQTKSFKSYVETSLNKELISKTDPETLQNVFTTLYTNLVDACYLRMNILNNIETSQPNNITFGLLLDNNLDSYLLISIIMAILSNNTSIEYTSNGPIDIHIFSYIDYKNNSFITFLEKMYNNIKIHYHYIISDGISDISLDLINDNSIDSSYELIYKYIKNNLVNLNLKIIISGFGLDNIWYNKQINVNKYESEASNNGFQIRFPYLDINFTNYINKLDASLKYINQSNNTQLIDKYIIKKAFANYLPTDFNFV